MVLEKLGGGGEGVVFKVRDRLEDKAKAIKIVPPHIIDSPLNFKNLKKEVNNASDIIHPHVVKVLGLEKQEDQYFIVMEYIDGHSLEKILADSSAGKLKEEEVISIMEETARGLHETHKKKVIHRDIKPANIMVTNDGKVKILDFGISYQVTKSMTELIGEQPKMGTWPYMAPEQLSNRFGKENEQVDVWGFGVTMYQLLSGQLPFKNKDQIIDKNEKPFELEGVSRNTRDIVMKCLEKDRGKRFQNMAEVLKALNAIPNRKKKPWIFVAASIIVLIVLAAFLIPILLQKEKNSVINQKEIWIVSKIKAVIVLAMKKVEILAKGKAERVYKNEKGFWEADYGDGIKMVYIPAGKFTMGSNDFEDAKPPQPIHLDGYWIGITEVTVGQYKKFISENGHRPLPLFVSTYSPGNDHPVVGVSWDDAVAYCKWLSDQKGINFKLPTEAQWEKAARGTDKQKYPWDDSPVTGSRANFADRKLLEKDSASSWADGKIDDGYAYTAPVHSYSEGASPYGLLNMAGNVFEWCSDLYKEDYNRDPDITKKNPEGSRSANTARVMRGGSWYGIEKYLRCAYRGNAEPSDLRRDVGFRLCQDNN